MNIKNIKQHLPLVGLGLLFVVVLGVVLTKFNKEAVDFTSSARSTAECNVSVVSIDGILDTNRTEDNLDSLSIAQTIRSLGLEKKEAILLLMDTPGGSAPAAEE